MTKEKYDIVIVGSGLGGLACAYILGKFGYNVCVLEKYFKTGGNLQTFKRKGCKFDTGMHYVGSLGEGEVLHKFFNYLDLLGKVDARKLDEDAFDVINIAGREYNYAMGYEKFTQSLIADFPEEKIAIQAYVDKIRTLSESSDIFNLREVNLMDTSNISSYGQCTTDFIASITDNLQLRSVLVALNPLYGGGEHTTPLYVHALVNHFFITSAWRLTKGGDQISDALTNSIQEMGGKVLTKSEVVKFHFEGKLMSAVETCNGNVFEADHFISNMHPSVTMDLVPDEKIRKSYKSRLTNLENTISAFSVYIVLEKNKIPYLNRNYYYYKTNNVWGVDNYSKGEWPQGLMLYFAEDKNNPEFAESVTIITYMKYEEVKKWDGTKIECRGEEYLAFKAEKERDVMTCVSQVFPDILDAIDTSYTSSPLSFKDYTGTKDGSMYGIVRDCNKPIESYLPSRTKISNLLLTGQSVNLHGITGVLCGALLTCGQLVDINAILQEINSCYPSEYTA